MKLALWGRRDPIAIATIVVCVAWIVIALTNWSDLITGISMGSPWGQYFARMGETMLFASGIHPAPLAATFVMIAAASIIGYSFVVAPIWPRAVTSGVVLLLAGLVPGSLAIIAVTRFVTLLIPHQPAVWIVWAVILGLTGAALWRLRARAPAVVFSRGDILGAIALCLVALIFQIHFDGFHVTGEASRWAIKNVFQSATHGLGTDVRLPLISLHYDEIALIYASAFGFVAPGPGAVDALTVMYWLWLGLGRVGMACLIYVAMRGFGLDRLSAAIGVAFIFAASLSLNPASSTLLFDSLSPLGYGLHTARVLAPVLPFLILSALINHDGPAPLRALPIAAVLGFGLSAMPIHLAIVFPWVFVLLVMTALNPAAALSRQPWRIACAAALACLLAMTCAYAAQSTPAPWRVLAMLGAAVIPAALMAWVAFSNRARVPIEQRDLVLVGMLVAAGIGYFIGVALFGNFLISRIAPYLDSVWPWRDLPVLERFDRYEVTPGLHIGQTPHCDSAWSWRNHPAPPPHCGSLPDFVRAYGLAFVAIAGVLAWRLSRLRAPRLTFDSRALTYVLWALALCLFLLPFAFVLYDFTGSPSQDRLSMWLLSRFVEPGFISGILIAIALFFREADANSRRWMQGLMLVCVALFAFNPLVFAGQWVANIQFFLDMLVLR